MKPILATCNESCKRTFELTEFLTSEISDVLCIKEGVAVKHSDVEKTYFLCPHCQHEYVAYYTDVEIRELQEQIRKIDRQTVKAQKQLSQKMFNQLTWRHARLRKVIAEKMAGLRERVEKGENNNVKS